MNYPELKLGVSFFGAANYELPRALARGFYIITKKIPQPKPEDYFTFYQLII
jgi:hypothetical protein